MAFPAIVFNSAEGSDGDGASGAGPATALTGTKARARVTVGGTRVGLFEVSPPDLSLVATDGSHAALVRAISGRQLFKVTAKKDAQQSTTGNMNGSTAVVSSMGSTTGMAANDAIKVAGAGPASADLYSEILTVDSGTQVTLKDNSSTSVTGNAVVDPKQVTVSNSVVLDSDKNWAIGGKRATPAGLTTTPLDVLPGWTVNFEDDIAHTLLSFTTAWNFSVDGDSTDGRITIRGTRNAAGRRPRLGGSASVSPITIRAKLYTVTGIEADGSDSLVKVDSAAAGDLLVEDCGTTDSNYVFWITAAAAGQRFAARSCEGGSIAVVPLKVEGPIVGLSVDNCYNFDVDFGGNASLLSMRRCISAYSDVSPAGNGLLVRAGATGIDVENCVFWGKLKGVKFEDLAGAKGAVVANNQFVSCTTGLECASAGAEKVVAVADYNNFWANTTPRTNFAAGAHDTAVDPQFKSVSGITDFGTGLSPRGAGWPVATADGSGFSNPTKTSVDIGYSQAPAPVGGTVLVRVVQVTDLGSSWEVAFDIASGAAIGSRQAVTVLKADIQTATTPNLTAAAGAVLAYLRDGQEANLVGREMLV